MKNKFLYIILFLAIINNSCKKDIEATKQLDCNFIDSSSTLPKNNIYKGVIDKYIKKGLPGISVLVTDSNGTWVGASGYADIKNGVKFTPCHISKAASITKLLVGTLLFKLQEEGKINV
ncbi:MAG: hypothetical protein COZ59_04580, partial [Bacteroidetes bacterium CG_4_8_14_3_um_filter_31_14]